MQLRLDIQGLRALAVILVIIFHIDESWLSGGFIGVDIFFVISGFLISRSVMSQIDQKKFNLFKFFEGRVKRIVPAYLSMMLICAIIVSFLFIPNDFNNFYHQFKRTIVFLSNFLFATTDNYFGAESFENPLLHTWSLSIEMQFYLVLPVVLLILPKKWRLSFLLLAFVTLLTYTEYNIRFLGEQNKMYFSLLARSLEFIIGILIVFLPKLKNESNFLRNTITVVSFAVIILSAIMLSSESLFPGLLSLPACIGTALIIWVEQSKINQLLSSSIPNYIGKISYSLYLWHWPVLAIYRYYTISYKIDLFIIFALCLVFIILSLLSFYLVEERYRKMKGKKLYFRVSLISILTVSIWFFSNNINNKLIQIPNRYISPIQFTNHHKYNGEHLIGDVSKEDSKILIIGDSHGLAMIPFFNKLGKEKGLNFSPITMNIVPPLSGLNLDNFKDGVDRTVYSQLSTVVDEHIIQSDIIIIIRHWHKHYEFIEGLRTLYEKLENHQSLIILSDFPAVDKNPVREYKSLKKPTDFTPKTVTIPHLSKDVLDFINTKSNVYYLDIQDDDFFKEAPFFNDTLMYYDESHINFYGAEKLADYQGEKVAQFILSLKNR